MSKCCENCPFWKYHSGGVSYDYYSGEPEEYGPYHFCSNPKYHSKDDMIANCHELHQEYKKKYLEETKKWKDTLIQKLNVSDDESIYKINYIFKIEPISYGFKCKRYYAKVTKLDTNETQKISFIDSYDDYDLSSSAQALWRYASTNYRLSILNNLLNKRIYIRFYKNIKEAEIYGDKVIFGILTKIGTTNILKTDTGDIIPFSLNQVWLFAEDGIFSNNKHNSSRPYLDKNDYATYRSYDACGKGKYFLRSDN